MMNPVDSNRRSSSLRSLWVCLLFPMLGMGCREEVSPSVARSARKRPISETQEAVPKKKVPSAGDRLLIVHADDAGMCRSVNRGTIEALEAGVVTSASIMVTCPAFEEFAEYAREHPEYDYGIHLTLNAEYRDYRWGPVLGASEVPSLVDGAGYLLQSEHQTAANARIDDVERELRAQIDRALDHGVPLSHLDTHMGTLFMRPDFVEVYLRLGTDYQLPVLMVRDTSFARQLGVDERVIARMEEYATALEQDGFPVLDDVFMHYSSDSVDSKRRSYLNAFRNVQPGVTEIIIHCGVSDHELRSITLRHSIRDGDRQVFTDPEFLSEVQQAHVTLINWKQLMQMSSKSTVAD
ncbi:MAG: polysaccharide deacetylase family protein [Planctomycetaceae bacterium]|nr:polysaccharide deacetylase family protein [Planctomycetaceae bacterium]